jgi:aryl-alcohol dehydrogenase-like predicted oxidoreductase
MSMSTNAISAAPSGRFTLGGDMPVTRLGFGAMRITGAGIWGPPADRAECLRTLKRVPELGIDFIDTANSYGPDVSEELIREALHPYDGLIIATKAGHIRPGPNTWVMDGRPEHLIEETKKSLKKLGVERIDLWQLHRIDPKVPRADQFGAVRQLLDQGLIRHAGLSEVSVADIEEARRYFPVVSVQNRYNLVVRGSEAVLDYCEREAISFIPWHPIGAGNLAKPGTLLDAVARAHGATPSQIALAWVLKRSPVMLPIPGTGKVAHLEENTAAAAISLTDAEFAALDAAGRAAG